MPKTGEAVTVKTQHKANVLNTFLLLTSANTSPLLLSTYFFLRGETISLQFLFIYSSKLILNCVGFQLCGFFSTSCPNSLLSISLSVKYCHQQILSVCGNFYWSTLCLWYTPFSPLLFKNAAETTRHHHIQRLEILFYARVSRLACVRLQTHVFIWDSNAAYVIFFHLPDRLELKGWCQEANNRILILYNPLSTCLCCFQAKDFASPTGASVFQVQNQVFHQSFLDTV